MKVKVIYPTLNKVNIFFMRARRIVKWLFIVAAISCLVVNIAVKGKWWSVIVIWSMFSVWNVFFSPDSIEFNLISQTVKAVFYTCILLALIDYFLIPGWSMFVIPIILFGALILTTIFLLIDYRSQLSNTMPMMWLVVFSIIMTISALAGWTEVNWPIMVLGSIAFSILFLFVFFHSDFIRELKKRFHTN